MKHEHQQIVSQLQQQQQQQQQGSSQQQQQQEQRPHVTEAEKAKWSRHFQMLLAELDNMPPHVAQSFLDEAYPRVRNRSR